MHKPHQTGTTKLVGTNHSQLPWPHTWASNTSNLAPATHAWHQPILAPQPGTTNLAPPTWHHDHTLRHHQPGTTGPGTTTSRGHKPGTSNWRHQPRGHQSQPIVMPPHFWIKHTNLAPPHTLAPPHPTGTTNLVHHQPGTLIAMAPPT